MLNAGEKMAYPFEGYWKTWEPSTALWEANMDLLDPNVPLDVWESDWKIYSCTSGRPGHYISEHARVDNSMLTEGCLGGRHRVQQHPCLPASRWAAAQWWNPPF